MKPAISSYGVSDLRVVARVTCVSCDLIAFASFAVCCGALALLCLQIFVAQCCHGYPLLHLICLVSQPTFKATVPKLILTDEFDCGFQAGHTKAYNNIFCHEFIFLFFMLCLVSKNQFNPHLLHCFWMHFLMNLLNLGEQLYILKKVITTQDCTKSTKVYIYFVLLSKLKGSWRLKEQC